MHKLTLNYWLESYTSYVNTNLFFETSEILLMDFKLVCSAKDGSGVEDSEGNGTDSSKPEEQEVLRMDLTDDLLYMLRDGERIVFFMRLLNVKSLEAAGEFSRSRVPTFIVELLLGAVAINV